MKKLEIGQQITFEGKQYRVNGFDEYTLTNIYGGTKEWTSITIINVADDKDRIWLGYNITQGYYVKQWLIPEKEFIEKTAKASFNGDFTGIANITFVGDQGYSLPVSEIIWYDQSNKDNDFLVIERFLEHNSDTTKALKSYYHEMKILKDFTV